MKAGEEQHAPDLIQPLFFAAGSIDITPEHPVPLAGYARRTGNFEAIDDRLEANAILLKQGDARSLILSVDLLYAGRALREELLRRLGGGISDEQLLIGASHTHYGPATDPSLPRLGAMDRGYFDYLAGRLESLLQEILHAEPGPAVLGYAERTGDHSVNRRLVRRLSITRKGLRRNSVVRAPNEAGPRDETVRLLSVREPTSGLGCVLWNYGCHPVGLPAENHVSAHFPGVVRAAIRKDHGEDLPALFLQGFAGDIRPRLPVARGGIKSRIRAMMAGPRFPAMTQEAWSRWTGALATTVLDALEAAEAGAGVSGGELSSSRIEVPLRRFVPGADDDRAVTFQSVRIDRRVRLVGVSAEPVVEIGSVLRGLAPDTSTIPVGCIDGVFGYLPTREMIESGGYEGGGFLPEFSLTGPLSEAAEEECRRALAQLLRS